MPHHAKRAYGAVRSGRTRAAEELPGQWLMCTKQDMCASRVTPKEGVMHQA